MASTIPAHDACACTLYGVSRRDCARLHNAETFAQRMIETRKQLDML
jgi:hypothetical protein